MKAKQKGMFSIVVMLMTHLIGTSSSVSIHRSAYRNIVIEISDAVPVNNCSNILSSLESGMTAASQHLLTALDSRAYFGSVVILLPSSWPDFCLPPNRTIVPSSGEISDITVTKTHALHGDEPWTQQSAGCGETGDQIYLGYSVLDQQQPQHHNTVIGKKLIREWAKYRYGVFDEHGYYDDPIYPMCYKTNKEHVTGCSDLPILDNGICDKSNEMSLNFTKSVDPNARSSIMFAAEARNVEMFCDEGTHNRYAPTKHNQICNRRSTLDVILKHPDFSADNMLELSPSTIINTTPVFEYKKRIVTRYILIIDETQDMMVRESWSFLRNAIRKWVVYDLPGNTELGIVLANTASDKILPLSKLAVQKNRDIVASFIPYSPSDSRQPACMNCALSSAMSMMAERERNMGEAASVIVVIAPGMDYNTDVSNFTRIANKNNIKMNTINYPGVIRRQRLDALAEQTHGTGYTIYEKKLNSETTFLTTYFELTNVLYSISARNYEGNVLDLPIEVHRKELVDMMDDSASSSSSKRVNRQITGSFMLDSSMGSPASFFVYTHSVNPLIQSITLTSPNGITYSTKSDERLPVKQLTILAAINETGSWSYTIDRINGNPQPHYVQVMATPKYGSAAVIQARAWYKRPLGGGPIALYVEVKKGELPILSALVEVTITRPEMHCNATRECKQTITLLDTGSGDPDISKGDGIYTRYFSPLTTGEGAYKFEIIVTDNGNTAYSLMELNTREKQTENKCCGSVVPTPSKQSLPSFQRVLPPINIYFTKSDLATDAKMFAGKIGDLKAEVLDGLKVRLSWTSPDMGGLTVARYLVKYSQNVEDIADNFDTATHQWDHDTALPYSIGDDTSFALNFKSEPILIGKPLYFAIRAYTQLLNDTIASPISNYVRVFVPPLPQTTLIPTRSTDMIDSSWPYNDSENSNDQSNPSQTNLSKTLHIGLEYIIPIVCGIILLAAILIIYCVCLARRRTSDSSDQKIPIKYAGAKHDEITSSNNKNGSLCSPSNNVTNSATHHNMSPSPTHDFVSQGYMVSPDAPNPHTVGLPTYNAEDELSKNRYSLVNQQEQQLIEELKHQQHQRDMVPAPNTYTQCNLSIISSTNNTLTRNGRILSPYESWTASQLLHEHERRQSPLMDDMMNQSNDQIQYMHQQPSTDAINNMGQQHCNADRMSLSGGGGGGAGGGNHNQMVPQVPPLPYTNNGYVSSYTIYGVHNNIPNQPPPTYSSISRNQPSFNPSAEGGSMCSVNSSDKKRRNVTMV